MGMNASYTRHCHLQSNHDGLQNHVNHKDSIFSHCLRYCVANAGGRYFLANTYFQDFRNVQTSLASTKYVATIYTRWEKGSEVDIKYQLRRRNNVDRGQRDYNYKRAASKPDLRCTP